MDKYFIIPKKHLYYYRYSGCEYLNGVEPGTILNGPGSWRCLDNDIVNVESYGNFKRIIHRNKNKWKGMKGNGVSGTLRLNDDGTVDEVKIYLLDVVIIDYDFDESDITCGYKLYIPELNRESVNVEKLMYNRIREEYPQYERLIGSLYYDVHYYMYKYYKKHGGGSTTFVNDFLDAFIKTFIIKNARKYEMRKYFPKITKKMFIFDGGVEHFDTVRILIPMTNPDRDKYSTLSIIKAYKKEIFTMVYDKLEEYSGIPKGYFKMDNCTLTCDDCLSFICSLKEIPEDNK